MAASCHFVAGGRPRGSALHAPPGASPLSARLPARCRPIAGATFHALPSINLEALPGAQAAGVPARAAAAGGGAAAGKGEAPAASADESARQEREEAAGFAAEAQVLRVSAEVGQQAATLRQFVSQQFMMSSAWVQL